MNIEYPIPYRPKSYLSCRKYYTEPLHIDFSYISSILYNILYIINELILQICIKLILYIHPIQSTNVGVCFFR